MHQFFADNSQCRYLRLKLVPNFMVVLARTRQSSNTSCPLHRIERSEVAQFHGEAAWGSSHFGGDFHNDWIAFVKFSERQFAIEIQRDEGMFACPSHVGSFAHIQP